MLFSSLLTKLGFTKAPAARRRPPRCRPQLEALEGRCVPAAHHPLLLGPVTAAPLGSYPMTVSRDHASSGQGLIHILAALTDEGKNSTNERGTNGGSEPGGNQGNGGSSGSSNQGGGGVELPPGSVNPPSPGNGQSGGGVELPPGGTINMPGPGNGSGGTSGTINPPGTGNGPY
jgi:hypothetical protein